MCIIEVTKIAVNESTRFPNLQSPHHHATFPFAKAISKRLDRDLASATLSTFANAMQIRRMCCSSSNESTRIARGKILDGIKERGKEIK